MYGIEKSGKVMLLRKVFEESFENPPKTSLKQFIDSNDISQGMSLFTNANLERVANGIRLQNYSQNKLAMN